MSVLQKYEQSVLFGVSRQECDNIKINGHRKNFDWIQTEKIRFHQVLHTFILT
jgi:hypothetical protein